MRSLFKYLSTLTLLFTLQLLSSNALANLTTASINCTNSTDASSCTLDVGDAPFSVIELAAKVMEAASDPSASPLCSPGGDQYLCDISEVAPVLLNCTGTVGSISCELFNAPDALTIDCNESTGAGSCNFNSNTEELITAANLESSIEQSLANCINSPGTEVCSAFLNAIQDGTLEDLVAALTPIAPELALNLTGQNIRTLTDTLQQRLFRLRNNNPEVAQVTENLYWVNQQYAQIGDTFAQDETMATDAMPFEVTAEKNISEYGKLGFFINAAFIQSDFDNDILESDSSSSTLTLGIDYRFTNSLVGGVAFNLGSSTTDIESSADSEIKTSSFSSVFYGSYYINNWFLDGSLLIGGTDYEQERSPLTINNSYEADYRGDEINLSLATGYDFTIGSWNITPYAQYNIGEVTIDEYRETATNSTGPGAGNTLELDEVSQDVQSLNIGTYIRYVFSTDAGVFIPQVTLSVIEDLEDDAQTVTGRYVNNFGDDTTFELATGEPDSSYTVIGAGFSFQLKNGNAGFVNIETVEGYEDLSQQRYTLGWRLEI